MISVEAFLAKHPVVPPAPGDATGEEDRTMTQGAEWADGQVDEPTESQSDGQFDGGEGFAISGRFGAIPVRGVRAGGIRTRNTRGNGTRMTRANGVFRSKNGAQPPEDPKDLDACREAALRLLDAAPRASGALRERLTDKGYDPDVVDDVIDRLIRVQLLDDQAYAESAVRYCAGRLLGRRATVMELTRKGVERALAERVCAEAESQGVFEDAAWELGRQIARKTQGLDSEVRRRRLWSTGGRKGHSPDVLRAIAQELF